MFLILDLDGNNLRGIKQTTFKLLQWEEHDEHVSLKDANNSTEL